MAEPCENETPSMYQEGNLVAGVSGRRGRRLVACHRAYRGPFHASKTSCVPGIDLRWTGRLMAGLAEYGWLIRVRNVWYVNVPQNVWEPENCREDPRVVASTLLPPVTWAPGALLSIGD